MELVASARFGTLQRLTHNSCASRRAALTESFRSWKAAEVVGIDAVPECTGTVAGLAPDIQASGRPQTPLHSPNSLMCVRTPIARLDPTALADKRNLG